MLYEEIYYNGYHSAKTINMNVKHLHKNQIGRIDSDVRSWICKIRYMVSNILVFKTFLDTKLMLKLY